MYTHKLAPFGFWKKNPDKDDGNSSNSGDAAEKGQKQKPLQPRQESISKDRTETGETIRSSSSEELTISQAQSLLRDLESTTLADLQRELTPIRDSALKTLSILNEIAEAMQSEELKFEDGEARHKSVAENSRRAVVSTLKREAASELSLPSSINDVKKFRERMESMLNRFGEVSGSHSKLLNYFLKKQSGRMKQKFGELQELLKQTRSIISDYEQKRVPLVKCSNLLNSAAQMSATSKSAENALHSAESDLANLEVHLAQTTRELEDIKQLPEYPDAVSVVEKIANVEKRQQSNREKTAASFSYITRVLAKYSYGLGKDATSRVQIMSEEPWRLLEQDLDPYLAILTELRKSVMAGSMQTKDSDKIVGYIDSVIESLPELKQANVTLQEEANTLLRNDRKSLAYKARDLEATIENQRDKLTAARQSVEQMKKQLAQRTEETKKILAEAEEIIATLSGSKHALKLDN